MISRTSSGLFWILSFSSLRKNWWLSQMLLTLLHFKNHLYILLENITIFKSIVLLCHTDLLLSNQKPSSWYKIFPKNSCVTSLKLKQMMISTSHSETQHFPEFFEFTLQVPLQNFESLGIKTSPELTFLHYFSIILAFYGNHS